MAVKLHRCSNVWVKVGGHPCWRVQKALDDAGIEYELVRHPNRRSKRTEYEAMAGTKLFPAIEFEDGRILREESKDLKARIEAGRLFETEDAPAAQ